MSEKKQTVSGAVATAYSLRGTGPYKARSASDHTDNWFFWYVTPIADGRMNVLSFPDLPGAVFTCRSMAEAIAADANKQNTP